MAKMSDEEKAVRKIIRKTEKDMQSLGTYRPQFDSAIRVYSEMRFQYDVLMQQFYADGCKISEEYTNKAGAKNIRKTAMYLSLETLRKDIVNHENLLGLTPAGLKRINDEMAKKKKKMSKLDLALSSLDK
ncbi:P27 family phage terminase small subunit [Bacillus sp. 2205SS5-2]|uniref:P27 family phage terminase small subunit n=1 Tax=Bacillus sp. 2205SS5-2 TaxID=3109031 RepID=UPI003005AE74